MIDPVNETGQHHDLRYVALGPGRGYRRGGCGILICSPSTPLEVVSDVWLLNVSDHPTPDWDPRDASVLRDQRRAYDEMRKHCPVAYSDFLGWTLFQHQDIVSVLADPETYSSASSRPAPCPTAWIHPSTPGTVAFWSRTSGLNRWRRSRHAAGLLRLT